MDNNKELDEFIERLRQNYTIEEKHRKELKKREKLKEALKDGKRTNKKVYGNSYDHKGNVVDIKQFKALPTLSTKCVNKITHEETVTPKVLKQAHVNRIKPAKHEGLKEERSDNVTIYNAIVPVVGVTFKEIGKTPKKNGGSFGEKIGRISKYDFHHWQAKPSTRNNNTEIQKPTINEDSSQINIEHQGRTIKKVISMTNNCKVKVTMLENLSDLLISNTFSLSSMINTPQQIERAQTRGFVPTTIKRPLTTKSNYRMRKGKFKSKVS